MAHPGTFLNPPACKHADGEPDALQATACLREQNPEDLCLARRIEIALYATGYGALRAIKVFVNSRVVMLLGRVPSYHLKQIAQVTVLAVPGTHQIRNNLDVMPPT